MSILERFSDIVKSNINALLDKAEDPSKMIDQYLRDLTKSLAEVKRETAGVMAEETRTKRMLDENQAEIAKYENLAKKALQAGNEGDARTFIAKKQELAGLGNSLTTTYAVAHENAQKMRQMHDKLVSDIEALNSRSAMIKAKVSIAKTQEKVNGIASSGDSAAKAKAAFERMEDKADKMLDTANALAELNEQKPDSAQELEAKYEEIGANAAVEDELEQLKKSMGL